MIKLLTKLHPSVTLTKFTRRIRSSFIPLQPLQYNSKSYFSEIVTPNIPISNEAQQLIQTQESSKIRNIAIIAHVDHGKTTLVDSLLRIAGINLSQKECVMDSNILQKEKGITILSKCTSVLYNGFKINIVDTPGHHDFGGQVERIMNMVDGVCLLICATEGPMAQSKFVLRKAIQNNLKPIVIINKVDRPSARTKEVVNQIFQLFCDLNCPDHLIDYPIYYASGKNGWAVKNLQDEKVNVNCILDCIIKQVPAPKILANKNFSLVISQTQNNYYFGKMCLGRINSGYIEVGKKLSSYDQNGKNVETGRVTKIVRRLGLNQIQMSRAFPGDIVSIAGFPNSTVTHTLSEEGLKHVIPCVKIDPPMMTININVNTSPLAGKQGQKLTLNQIKNRLIIQAQNDVALAVQVTKNKSNSISVKGRGDLHLGILLEKMRRQGFELSVTPPEIVFKNDEKSQQVMEPIEKVIIELHPNFSQNIIEKMNNRKGIYLASSEIDKDRMRFEFLCPTRGLIGLRTQLLNETQGTAMIKTTFHEYQPYLGPLKKNPKGAIISMSDGIVTPYSLKQIQKFGSLFIKPGHKVYNGLVIGQTNKQEDIEVNPTKQKKVTNIRTHSHDQKVVLVPAKSFTIEQAICYVRDDQLLQITPKEVRIRKKDLDKGGRDRYRREQKNQRSN